MARLIAIFAAIIGALIMSQFMRAAVSVVAPDIMAESGLDAEAYGSMAGAFFFGVAAAQIPAGLLLDRFGARFTMAGMQTLAAAGTLWFAFADSFTTMFAARFITGAGFSSALMGGFVVAARWFPPDRFSQVGGALIAVSGAIGLMMAATPMALISGAFGWRTGFVMFGVLTLVTGLVVLWLVRDAPPGHPWHERKRESAAEILKGYATILRLKGVPLVILMALSGYPTMITLIGVWGGPYLHDVHGLDGVSRGNVLLFLIGGSVTGLLLYGPVERLVDSRKYVVIGGVVLSAAVLAALALIPSPPLWLVAVLFVLYGVAGSYYLTNIGHGRARYPDHMVGRGVTTVNIGTFIGVALVQFATALLMGAFGPGPGDAGAPAEAYRTLFGALALLALVLAAFYTRIDDIRPSQERARAQGRRHGAR